MKTFMILDASDENDWAGHLSRMVVSLCLGSVFWLFSSGNSRHLLGNCLQLFVVADGLGFTALENRNSSKLAHSVIPSVAGTSGGFTAAQTVAAKDGEGPHSAESINGDSHARESSGSAVSTHSGELSQEKEISGSEEGDFSQFDYSPSK